MCGMWSGERGRNQGKGFIFESHFSNLSLPASNSPARDWQSCSGHGHMPGDKHARPVNTLTALCSRWSYETSPELTHKLSKDSREGNAEKEGRAQRRAWQVFLLHLQLTLISVWGLAPTPAPVTCVVRYMQNTSNDACCDPIPKHTSCVIWLIDAHVLPLSATRLHLTYASVT